MFLRGNLLFKLSLNCRLVKPSYVLIDQLDQSIEEKFQTLVFHTAITWFGPYIQTAVRIFSHVDLTLGQQEHINLRIAYSVYLGHFCPTEGLGPAT